MRNQLSPILCYLIGKLDGSVARTQLVKYTYLYDLEAVQQDLHSGVTWRSYYYGPYSEEIVNTLKQMDGCEIMEEPWFSPLSGKQGYVYRKGPLFANNSLNGKQRSILDGLIDRYRNLSLEEMLRDVYETEQYRQAAFGDEIPLKD